MDKNRPGYKKTKIGWLPDDWDVDILHRLGSRNRPAIKAGPFGSALKKEFYVSSGYKIYGQEQVISGNPFFGNYYIDKQKFNELKSCEVMPGDLLISLVGTIGKVLVIPPKAEKGIINPRLLRLSLDTKKINVFFAKYYFENSKTLRILNSWAQGGTMGVLNAQIVGVLSIPLPPLPEQQKIADILSTWDRARDKMEKLIEAKTTYKKALMQQLLTGKMRFPEFGKPTIKKGALPEGWKDIRLKSFLTESRIPGTSGKVAKKLTVKLYGKGVIPKTDIRPGSTKTQYYIRKSGQFIYSKLDFLNGAFGLIPKELNNYETTLDLPAFDVVESVNPKWFLHFVSRESFYKSHLGLANGGRKARRVHPKSFLMVKAFFPPRIEQDRITAVLDACDREIELHRKQEEALKQQKKGLMQKLLTGQIRVKP